MAESTFQSEIPKARVNIRLDLCTGSAQKKVELPLKLLALGSFSNGKESRPLAPDAMRTIVGSLQLTWDDEQGNVLAFDEQAEGGRHERFPDE